MEAERKKSLGGQHLKEHEFQKERVQKNRVRYALRNNHEDFPEEKDMSLQTEGAHLVSNSMHAGKDNNSH